LLANCIGANSAAARYSRLGRDLGRRVRRRRCRPGRCIGASEKRDAAAFRLATYRLQIPPDFGFDQAAAVVPYLKSLGITHLYASPFLKARAGSSTATTSSITMHFNPELGGKKDFCG
jgi:hypothetical protein